MFPLALIASLAGFLLLISALRGRRTDKNPVCRRCRFDLIGLTSPALCPECGADLSRPRAVRTGNRRPRPRIRAIALLLLVTGLGLGAFSTYQATRAGNAAQWKPGWWLRADLRGNNPSLATAAIAEFASRAKKLSTSQRIAAARAALDRQGDPVLSWTPAFGDFIEAARIEGLLPDAEWLRYARHAAAVTLQARPVVRQGDTPPIDLVITSRAGSGPTFIARLRGTSIKLANQELAKGVFLMNAQLGGQPFATDIHRAPLLPSIAVSTFSMPDMRTPSNPDATVSAPTGSHTLSSSWSISIHEAHTATNGVINEYGWQTNDRQPLLLKSLSSELAPLAQFDLAPSAPLSVVPADAQTVELATDESLTAAVGGSLAFALYFERSSGQLGQGNVNGSISVTNLPIHIAARVLLIENGVERRVGSTVIKAAPGSRGVGISLMLPAMPESGAVSLIFRPDPDTARKTPDITRIWGRDIRFDNIKVAPHPPWVTPAPVAPAQNGKGDAPEASSGGG